MTSEDNAAISQTVRVDGHLVTISCRYLLDRNLWEPMALIHPAWGARADLELVADPQGCRDTVDDALDVATDLVVAWMRDQSGTDLRRRATNPNTPGPANISA
jgi:hypothetical protein